MKFTEVSLFDLQPFSVSATKSNLADRSPSELAEEGIQRAAEAASEILKRMALAKLRDLCQTHQKVNADMLEMDLGNVTGWVFREAIKMKWIRFSGEYVNSTVPKKHGRVIRTWESLLYDR